MTDPKRNPYLRLLSAGAAVLFPMFFAACGDNGNPDPDPDPPVADSLFVRPDTGSFDAIGDTLRLTATVLDQYGDAMTGLSILWASDNPAIASVDQTGLVTAEGDGETDIRAQAASVRGSALVEVEQEAFAIEALAGDGQAHWTGFLLADSLVVKVVDRAGTAVVGEAVTWEVLEGNGTVIPLAAVTDSDGEASARWALGEGESGVQKVSAAAADLDPVFFEATGSAAVVLINTGALTAPMLDTVTAKVMTRDSLGLPESGVALDFEGITGFGEVVQGPTTTDINAELEIQWALGPTPGPQRVTVARSDDAGELEVVASATGVLDPWPFALVSPGFYHTCAVDEDGSGFCWGSNDQSQLAMEDTLPVLTPAAIPTTLTWDDLGGGEFHTCGLTPNGAIYCWGQGFQTGVDGDGTQVVTEPTLVAGGPWASQAVGATHTCALKSNDTGWCWGNEIEGRLGNGNLDPTATPTLISGGYSWSDLSSGHFHTCGLTQAGGAYCWGRGEEGQLGDGGAANQGAPVLVAGGNSWKAVSAGRFHSCGISVTGDAFCWGEGGFNQLGNGLTADQTSPVKVAGGHNWTDIAAGQVHTCGIDVDHKLYCWGAGQAIGIGGFNSSIPAVVLPAYDWMAVQTQGIHTCAIRSNGESYCWGLNGGGQLGIGNTDDSNVPRILVRGVLAP